MVERQRRHRRPARSYTQERSLPAPNWRVKPGPGSRFARMSREAVETSWSTAEWSSSDLRVHGWSRQRNNDSQR